MDTIYNDGGRAAAGFKGAAGDCVVRAIAIAAELPYAEVYATCAKGNASIRVGRKTKPGAKRRSARNGTYTNRKWFQDYMRSLGFEWVSTMGIGTGCKVHLETGELPKGRLVVRVSKHVCAVIDGVIHDTFNPSRKPYTQIETRNGIETRTLIGGRCVYGYWIKREPELAWWNE